MEIKGRHLIEGVPKTITITDEEIREALAETVNVIVDAVRVALERTPPELSADIVDRGIVLTGGGSLLKNLDKRLREETGLPLAMAEDPLSSVVLGAGQDAVGFQPAAEDLDRLDGRVPTTARLGPVQRRYGRCSTSASAPATCSSPWSSAHIVLISAQVQLEARRAGARGGDLRRRSPRCSATAARGRRAVRRRLERLRRPARRRAARTSTLQARAGELRRSRCSRSARSPSAARGLRAAARPARARRAADDGGRRHRRRRRRPDFRTVTIDKGTRDGPAARHGRHRAGRRRRPRRRAERARGEGAAADRSQRGGRRARSSGRARRASSSAPATIACGWTTCRTSPTSTVGDVVVTSGIDGIYPKGFVIGQVESVERSGGAYSAIVVRPAVDFSALEEVLVVLTPTPGARQPAGRGHASESRRASILAIALALALQTTLARFVVRGHGRGRPGARRRGLRRADDRARRPGCWPGALAGLVQDALSSGVIGIGGLAKTIVGFLAGVDRHAVHRRAAAAAVRDVLRRDGRARGRASWGCTRCSDSRRLRVAVRGGR